MRLLNTIDFTFAEFFDDEIPTYAVISHRWSDDEVSHQTFLSIGHVLQNHVPTSYGWVKIAKACEIARQDSLAWVWIDTCCIDKTSSAELSEAINSMYDWYRFAKRCYVFLPDVPSGASCACDPIHQGGDGLVKLESAEASFCVRQFKASSWFTRSWTLQELLAPSMRLNFYNTEFKRIGKVTQMVEIVSEAANIPPTYVARREGRSASIAQKLSWASRREASRAEDIAYSLLGLCGVNMPLLYGEGGKRAFLRLQKEIIATTDDESIFCWLLFTWIDAEGGDAGMKVLADHPKQFATDIDFIPETEVNDSPHNQVTNKGIKFDIALSRQKLNEASQRIAKSGTANGDQVDFTFILPLSVLAHYRNGQHQKEVALRIRLPPQRYSSGANVQSKRVLHGRRYGQLLVRDRRKPVNDNVRSEEEDDVRKPPWVGAQLGKFEADNYVVHESADGSEVDYAVYLEI